MDVAGALGFTMIFPFFIGGILLIVGCVWVEDAKGIHDKIVARRIIFTSFFLLGLAVVGWIVAIWMGYAQGAMIT